MDHFTLVSNVVRSGDGQGRVNFEVVKEALRRGVGVTIVASEIAPELVSDDRIEWLRVSVAGLPSYLLRERAFSALSARLLKRRRRGPLLSNGCVTGVPAERPRVVSLHLYGRSMSNFNIYDVEARTRRRIERDDPGYTALSQAWSKAIRKGFEELPAFPE